MSKYWDSVREDRLRAHQEQIFGQVLSAIMVGTFACAVAIKCSGLWPIFGACVVVCAGTGMLMLWFLLGSRIVSQLIVESRH